MKKQLLMGTLAATMLVGTAAPVFAEDAGSGIDVSANVGLVSDYLWRGVSQSNNQAAIQGGIDLKHSSGAYAGLWMSSLSGWYNAGGGNDYASSEQDIYAGYGMSITKDISLDVRYTQFMYGNASSANFDELHASVSAFGATVGADYADNSANGNASTMHYYGSYGMSLPMDVSLSATVGEYDLKDPYFSNNEKYAYWNVGVSKKFAGINWGLSYNNSDLSGMECAGASGSITKTANDAREACGEQFVLSASKAL